MARVSSAVGAALRVAVLGLAINGTGARAADAAAGAALYKQRCQMCHSVKPGDKGVLAPNLSGVAGRKAGIAAFVYSPALTKSGLMWDAKTLEAFLAAPNRMVPGTRMIVSIPDAKQRGDVVTYLGTLR